MTQTAVAYRNVRARRAPELDSPRVRGVFLLALAALVGLEPLVLNVVLKTPLTGAVLWTWTQAAVLAALGVAVRQGSDSARRLLTLLTGTGLVGAGVVGLLAWALGYGHLWPTFAASAALQAGILLVNWGDEVDKPRAAAGIGLAAVGWVAAIVAHVFLAGTLDLGSIRTIREWTSAGREARHEPSALVMKLPPSWVLLKPGSPLETTEGAVLSLASTEINSTAQVFRETRSASPEDTVEAMLQGHAEQLRPVTTGLEVHGVDASTVGGVEARTLRLSYKDASGWWRAARVVGWRDADVFYRLVVVAPAVVGQRVDEETAALVQGTQFGAIRATFLRDRAPLIRAGCPLLSETTLVALLDVAPQPTPGGFCRAAYGLAFEGLKTLDPAAVRRLAELTQEFREAVPRTRIAQFGAWLETIRALRSTTPEDDDRAADAVRDTMAALPPATQEELRVLLARAIDMGKFGQRMR